MKKNLVLLSGISGSGKTSASNIFEDQGYLCIDNYPSVLIPEFIKLLQETSDTKYDKVVFVITLTDLNKYEQLLNNSEINIKLVLVDASSETIIKRYKFTRRIHPLLIQNKVNTLQEAIEFEKELLKPYINQAIYIDTTKISISKQTNKLKVLLKKDQKLTITFESFGFKHGIVRDSDMVIDVRMLDNPFYDDNLKVLTGNDKEIQDFVLNKNKTKEYLQVLNNYLNFVFEQYKNDSKHLTISVGCTGGQHRSVTIVNYLYDHYKDKYKCLKIHRELV